MRQSRWPSPNGEQTLCSRREERPLSRTSRASAEKYGAKVLTVPTDVADPAAVEKLAVQAEKEFDRIDAWINNTSVATYGQLFEVPLTEVRRAVDVNLVGCLNGMRAAVPRMHAAGGGVLVTIGSTLGVVTVPYLGAYTLTKHAVLALCNTLRQELRAQGATGISVCTVLPGGIDTPMFSHAGNHTGRKLRPPPPVSRPARVAERVVELLEHPRREAYVGLGSHTMTTQWKLTPGLSERALTWFGQRAQFVRGHSAPATTGNLFTPAAEQALVNGGWLDKHKYSRRTALVGAAASTAVFLHWYRKGRR